MQKRQWMAALALLALGFGCAPESWEAVNEKAKAASEAGDYARAAELFERGSTLGDATQSIMSLNNLGELHRALGQDAKAIEFYQQAIDVREEQLGVSPELGNSYANLAMHVRPFDVARSRTFAERALEIYEELFEENDPRIADALNNLGVLALQQGEFEAAEDYFTRAIETNQLSRGAGHPSLAVGRVNVAQLQLDQGKFEEAEANYLDALAVWKISRGEEHPDFARTEANLAELLRRVGRRDEAERRFLHAIEVLEAQMLDDDVRPADPLNNLALLYKESGDEASAATYYDRAIARLEKAYPSGHADLAATLFNRARLDAAAERHEAAITLFERADGMLEASPEEETRRLVRAAWADSLRALGRDDEASTVEG